MKRDWNVGTASPSPQLNSTKVVFSEQPTEPPTSPLPPLPVITSNRRSRRSLSTSLLPKKVRMRRPPRTQTSLPDLNSSTTTYPRYLIQDAPSTPAAGFLSSAFLTDDPTEQKSGTIESKSSQKQSTIRLLPPQLLDPNFVDDVLSALPRLFQQPPVDLIRTSDLSRFYVSANSEIVCPYAWQAYHNISNRDLAKQEYSDKWSEQHSAKPHPYTTSTLSAHICPNGWGSLSPYRDPRHSPIARHTQRTIDRCPATHQSLSGSPVSTDLVSTSSSDESHKYRWVRAHKRSCAVTSWDFDLDKTSQPYTKHPSDESLTSLPQLPSITTTKECKRRVSHHSKVQVHFSRSLETPSPTSNQNSMEHVTFLSLPYSHTLANKGPPPRMITRDQCPQLESAGAAESKSAASSQSQQGTPSGLGAEVVENGVQEAPTEEQLKQTRRRRLFSALATILLVLAATVGISCGIIWKLKSLASGGR